MKYELRHRSGKCNGVHWEVEWDFTVEAEAVFPDDIGITCIGSYSDYIWLYISDIPHRIENIDGYIWLRDKAYCEWRPEPVKPSYSNKITEIFRLGEREEVTIEEVGDIAYW